MSRWLSVLQCVGRSVPARLYIGACITAAILLSASLAGHLAGYSATQALRHASRQRLDLNAAAVRAEIWRNSPLPLVLSLDHDVPAALQATDPAISQALNRKLEQISKAAGGSILYVLDPTGRTVAASNWNTPGSFVGQDYSFRAYFADAMRHGTGRFFGVGTTTNRDGYFLAQAVKAGAGVVVVKIEFDQLEAAWTRAGEHIMVEDANGVIFLATNPAWKHRALRPLAPDRLQELRRSQQYAGDSLLALPVSSRGGALQIGEDRTYYLDQAEAMPDLGWTLHRLADMRPVQEAEWIGAVVGGSVSALLVAVVLYLRLRNQVLRTAQAEQARLEQGVADRTRELAQLNSDLRAAQDDLVRTGRLAALGEMSAVLVHEINQPLTAMGFELGSLRILARRADAPDMADGLDALSSLAERLAAMTLQLKTFARTGTAATLHPVPVRAAMRQAVSGMAAQLASARVIVELDCDGEAEVLAEGGQLQQVFGNLLRNALDATSGHVSPWIGVQVLGSQPNVLIRVADNGPGFQQSDLDRIFEPFFTTKPPGAGLGLGLSISYGIVGGFGGTMQACNRDTGGAEVMVVLRRAGRDGDDQGNGD